MVFCGSIWSLNLKENLVANLITDWRSLFCTPLCLCWAAHIHMDAQQLIGAGLNGFDESGRLGMWPWLSSCSLGAQQTISLNFSAWATRTRSLQERKKKKKKKRADNLLSHNNRKRLVNLFQEVLRGNYLRWPSYTLCYFSMSFLIFASFLHHLHVCVIWHIFLEISFFRFCA